MLKELFGVGVKKSTFKVPLNASNFHHQHIMHELAFLRFLRFLAQKMLQSKTKGDLPLYFLILNNFYFMKNPSKMPLSTLKLQFLFLQFSTQATLMSSTCPLDNFFDQNKLRESS